MNITQRKETKEQFHRAVQEVMSDASWFSQRVMERLANIRADDPEVTAVLELSKREREVLERLARGLKNEQIGEELGIATQTVRNHVVCYLV